MSFTFCFVWPIKKDLVNGAGRLSSIKCQRVASHSCETLREMLHNPLFLKCLFKVYVKRNFNVDSFVLQVLSNAHRISMEHTQLTLTRLYIFFQFCYIIFFCNPQNELRKLQHFVPLKNWCALCRTSF